MANDGLIGSINNGVYEKTDKSSELTKTTTTSSSISKASDGTTYDKDMFLQLLTAQMQYQDPLEPTSNTEYVAELASFTQIEAIQSVSDQMSNMQANSLVGKTVGIVSDNQEFYGPVDFVTTVDGQVCVSVDGNLYGVDKVQAVIDNDYYQAGLIADSIHSMIASLPNEEELSLNDAQDVATVRTIYDNLTDYYKKRVSEDDIKVLTALEEKIQRLKATAEE